jgi:protein AroM
MTGRIATVTIGQSPRPDLLEPLLARLSGDVEVVEVGALDQLTAATLPGGRARDDGVVAGYPLSTRMRDGRSVTLDEADLAPLVQAAIARAERAGAEVTLLLCAGGFLSATAHGTLVRPFDAAVERLRSLGARRIAVIVPFEAQAGPAARKWVDAGFDPILIVGDPRTMSPADHDLDVHALVLDYVGHPSAAFEALRSRTKLPLVDLGECGAVATASHFDHHVGTRSSGAS